MHKFSAFTSLALLLGCGGGPSTSGGTNSGGGPDSGSGEQPSTCSGTSAKAQFVFDTLTVPASKKDFAYDPTGDGSAHNQLGVLGQILVQSQISPQTGVDEAIKAGTLVLLLEELSKDASFAVDSCAQTIMYDGASATVEQMMNGKRATLVGGNQSSFSGTLKDSGYTSTAQQQVKTPVVLKLQVPLVSGTDALEIILTGATVSYRNATQQLSAGQINGVVKKADLQNSVLPGIARLLTQKVQRNLGMPDTNVKILDLFDTGGDAGEKPACPVDPANGKAPCQNLNGSCAKAKDGQIDDCEVSTGFLKYVLVPDVQMYDSKGNWAPNANNTLCANNAAQPCDSLSVGFGFSAIGVTF